MVARLSQQPPVHVSCFLFVFVSSFVRFFLFVCSFLVFVWMALSVYLLFQPLEFPQNF